MPKLIPKYRVLRDSAEHEGHGWYFPQEGICLGTRVENLFTADYSLEGLYDDKTFVIERKGSVSEWVSNIFTKEGWDDFKDELVRLEDFKHPFVICEFDFELIRAFPRGSGIPQRLWPKLKATPKSLMKRLAEIALNFKTPIYYCGADGGIAFAESLFKRMTEKYGQACPPQ